MAILTNPASPKASPGGLLILPLHLLLMGRYIPLQELRNSALHRVNSKAAEIIYLWLIVMIGILAQEILL